MITLINRKKYFFLIQGLGEHASDKCKHYKGTLTTNIKAITEPTLQNLLAIRNAMICLMIIFFSKLCRSNS